MKQKILYTFFGMILLLSFGLVLTSCGGVNDNTIKPGSDDTSDNSGNDSNKDELANYRTTAITEISSYPDFDKYDDENKKKIYTLIDECIINIKSATSLDEIFEKLATSKGLIDEIHIHTFEYQILTRPTDIYEGSISLKCSDNSCQKTWLFTLPVISEDNYKIESIEEGDCLNDGLDLCTYKIPEVSYKVSFEAPYSVYHDINPLTHVCSMCGYTDFSEYLEYELQNDNTYKVVGFSIDSLKDYSNIEYLIDIPSNYNGLEVSGISYNFGNNYLKNKGLVLKVVGIPKTIIKIDKATFGHEGFYIKYDGSKDEWNEFVSNNNWIKVYKN